MKWAFETCSKQLTSSDKTTPSNLSQTEPPTEEQALTLKACEGYAHSNHHTPLPEICQKFTDANISTL